MQQYCKQGSGTCKTCSSDSCNTIATFPSCITCSSENTQDCALAKHPEDLPTSVCLHYDDTCEEYVVDEHTYRDCKSSNIECLHPYCEHCSGQNCNKQIVPLSRLQCHQCSGEACAKDLETSELTLDYCWRYHHEDQCTTYKSGENKVVRGCLSDKDPECTKQGARCLKCNDPGCNTAPLQRAATLQCIKCQDAEACAWGFPGSQAVICKQPVELNDMEQCFVATLPGGIVQRGCINDSPSVCTQSGTSCTTCSTNGCNYYQLQEQTCIKCDSRYEKDCASDNVKLTPIRCLNLIEYETRGCYGKRLEDKNVTRGCFSDLSENDRTACLADNTTCVFCLGDGCNSEKVPGSSGHFSPGYLMFFLAFLLTFGQTSFSDFI